MPLDEIHNINPLIDKLTKGAVLECEDLVLISDFLRGCGKVKRFISDKEGCAKTLYEYSKNISDLKYIEDEINECIQGNRVASSASSELKKIRRHIDILEGDIKEKLEKFLKNSSNIEYIQEFFVSQRNGRYTIPIKTSYKNRVSGNIIETSSTGSTVFIELDTISKYTAKLEEYKINESVEEYRILSNISNMIFDKVKEIKINIEIIAEYPLINNTVPLNFEIGDSYRGLIITGPNAGGKTVVLKTVGLLSLAVQSGFHIRADEGSEFSIFENIFIDIGDNQSIENSLSTFSSHVKNLSDIIRKSNKSTLLLFDEIGSGTESNEGAALAISILEELYKGGGIVIASTHYGEIKNYDYTLVHDSKVRNIKAFEEEKASDRCIYCIGDKVKLLDKNISAIIYKPEDKYGNLLVLCNKQFIEVNYKRIELELKAKELYPEGYDLNQLFIEYKDRKLDHDIERGSKKALKKIKKEFSK